MHTSRDVHSPDGVAVGRPRGFSLLEMQIVIAVIAVVAAIVVPSLVASRLSANESAGVATLRTLVAAQAQFRESAKVDADQDGTGEYGGFAELSGAWAGRMAVPLVPPVLSGGFRFLNPSGEVTRNGYLYRIYLPRGDGSGLGEPAGGFVAASGVDGERAETTWCCYAWPVHHGHSGSRTFFVNQVGDVLAVDDALYSGRGNGPAADAAFTVPASITAPAAVSVAGQDGNTWRPVK